MIDKTDYTRKVENFYYHIACEDLNAAEKSLRALDKFSFSVIGKERQLHLSKGDNCHMATGFFWVSEELAKELTELFRAKLQPTRKIAIQKLKDVIEHYEKLEEV